MADDTKQPDNSFPSGYEHLEEWVQTAENRLHQLDAESQRPIGGPALIYNPPGFNTPPPPPRRSMEAIQREKADLKAEVYNRVEKETEAADPKTRKDLNDKALGRLYQEDIKEFKVAERRGLPGPDQGWALQEQLEEKQVQLLVKLKDYRDSQQMIESTQQPTSPTTPRPPDIEPTP